jgi:hypothetical protein
MSRQYHLTINPLPNHPNQPRRDVTLTLTDEQVAGINMMAALLWHRGDDILITITCLDGCPPDAPSYWDNNRDIYGADPEVYESPYLVADLRGEGLTYNPDTDGPWIDWINQLSDIDIDIDIDTNPITLPYTVVLQGRDDDDVFIAQFGTPEFLEGVLTVLDWYGLDPDLHILHIYQGNHEVFDQEEN